MALITKLNLNCVFYDDVKEGKYYYFIPLDWETDAVVKSVDMAFFGICEVGMF